MIRPAALLAVTAGLYLTVLVGPSYGDQTLEAAKAKVAVATAAAAKWDGPTEGPRAVATRSVVFVAADLKNAGILGVSRGVEEAGKAIGWSVRVIDGQGTVSGRTAALNQALALRPAGIVIGGFDTTEQKVAIRNAVSTGVTLVGWHSGELMGPDEKAGLFTNVTTSAVDVADVAAAWVVADSAGMAGVVIFTDSQYAIAVQKSRAMEAAIKRCGACRLLSVEDSPISESSTRIPQLTTSLMQRFGDRWTHSLAINDLYFDFMAPSLRAAGRPGDGTPRAVSAGDGSEAAYQRVRSRRYQAGSVPEPLNMQGWQIIDELNRAFAKAPWSGYVPKVHLVTASNVGTDGGPSNRFDPDNGYRITYRKIWGR